MTSLRTSPMTSEAAAETAAPLDALLVYAELGPRHRLTLDASTVRFAAALARQPRAGARRLASLGGELGRIAAGASTYAPSPRDARFADPAWSGNPVLRRCLQAYLATAKTAQQLVSDAELGWRDDTRVRFALENLIEAAAPSNLPMVNPAATKAVIDTAGLNVVRGATQLLHDMAVAPRIPQMVDTSAYEVGRNLAASPGAVVLRTEVFELIQYTPQTATVRSVPLVIVPPTINKYYALDLAPGRSLVEFLVGEGQQVFVLSWRNPDVRHAAWNLDTYVQAILEALDAVERITRSDQSALAGICSGGILACLAASYLAATGRQERLAALGLAVTVLDSSRAGTPGALVSRRMATAAKAVSERRGYLDGRTLAEVFAWLRPRDLIWNYWVNNYLLGRTPPAFDILYWNSDTTRMPAALHANFIDVSLDNLLVQPDAVTVLDVPVDLGRITVDSYVVAGIADHLTPWQNCYRTTQLVGGSSRFVLSTSGHIAALVNPPGNPKASYQVNEDNPRDPDEWLGTAETRPDTWWTDLSAWLGERCGHTKDAPEQLGGGGLAPLVDAPGTYVLDR